MWRYPDNTFRQTPPAQVVQGGSVRRFADLTREQRAALGYHEAQLLRREPFTSYVTEWRMGEDLILREQIVEAVVDEAARREHQANGIRKERDRRIEEVMWRVQRFESETRLGLTPCDDIAALDAYVQALRDVPQQEGFPEAVEWPAKT
jgi:hypothetical protein